MPQERIYTTGERIGAFRVERLRATGGMGTVYEATPDPVERDDLLSLGIQRVALKVPRLDALARTPEERRQLVERCEREYQTLLKLSHPRQRHLVEVYELGWHEGAPFLVMEYVDGPTLDELLARQPPLQAMLELFRTLCGTVAFLHGRGVCHRDLKPSNVLVSGGEPVLVDLGTCLTPTGHSLTGPGELVGSVLYASPEALAHWQDPDSDRPYLHTPADDVWALGVCLYEILTGNLPWRTPAGRRAALLKEIRRATPLHPSDVNPAVPRVLGDVALRLLARVAHKRPRNAAEALALLEAALRAVSAPGDVPARTWPVRGSSGLSRIRPAAWARSGDGLSRMQVTVMAALVLAGLGAGLAGRRVLDALCGASCAALATATVPASKAPGTAAPPDTGSPPGETAARHEAGAKEDPANPPDAADEPEAAGPLPGQLLPPCRKPYVEDSGGCWIQMQPVTPEGKPAPCPTNPYARELKGKDGRMHCFNAVMAPKKKTPNAEKASKGGR